MADDIQPDGGLREEPAAASPYNSRAWLNRWVRRFLPPAPPDQRLIETVNLRDAYRPRHWLLAGVTIVGVVALTNWLGNNASWTRWSPVRILGLTVLYPLIWLLEHHPGVTLAVMVPLQIVCLLLLLRLRGGGTVRGGVASVRQQHRSLRGMFSRWALAEEQAFREGAEHWTWSQRLVSCLIFSVAHLWNLFVPLSVLPALAIGGALFTAVYLRTLRRTGDRERAVIEAATLHRAYNTYALTMSGLFFGYVLLWPFLVLLTPWGG